MEILIALFALWFLWSVVGGRSGSTEAAPEPEVKGHASIRKR
jgi:hypothetical protein